MQQPDERPYLRVVPPAAGGTDHACTPLRVNRSTSAADTGGTWMQILEVITDLQLAIAEHQRQRREFEQWAARERRAIEREREALRGERRGNHRFW